MSEKEDPVEDVESQRPTVGAMVHNRGPSRPSRSPLN